MSITSAESIEAQVIELVAQVADVAPARVTLATRLRDDLGIDGDDAVALFCGVHERFGADLTHLHEKWSDHFGPEGISLLPLLVSIPVCVAVVFVFTPLRAVVGGVVVGVAASIVTLVMSFWLWRKLQPSIDLTPITVREVVEAVQVGAWPRSIS